MSDTTRTGGTEMDTEGRITVASELARQARKSLDEAMVAPTEAKQEEHLQEAAKRFKQAADFLEEGSLVR